MTRALLTAIVTGLILAGAPATNETALAQGAGRYRVKITNLTPGQRFTPILAAAHSASIALFLPGTFVSSELETLAEEGNVMPLMTLLSGMPSVVGDVVSAAGLTTPAVTRELELTAGGAFSRLSLVAMLIPTNDGFFGLDIALPTGNEVKVAYAYA